MNIDFAIKHAQEAGERLSKQCDTHECGLEHIQLASWLKELKKKRHSLNECKRTLANAISGFDKFFTEWEPYSKDNPFPYEKSLLDAYDNIQKLYENLVLSVDKTN